MAFRARMSEFNAAVGTSEELRAKLVNAWRTVATTFNRKERRRRLDCLKAEGHFDEIPNEWQIFLASYEMMTGFIMPSNTQFYEHYDQNMYWLQFLRVIDEPSTMMDPTGLAVSPEMVIQHILHVVHTSAGYDVGLLEMFPGALDELEKQLSEYVAGVHPRQASIAELLERPDYPERLLPALRKYREDPHTHWEVTTYETPDGCEELFDFGIARYGTLGRLLIYAMTLPKSPWESLIRAVKLNPALSPEG